MKKAPLVIILVLLLAGLVGAFFLIKKAPKNAPTGQTVQKEATGKTLPGYSGKVLAGQNSPYLDFTKADYEKAAGEGKIVILNFYANWCPVCRVEQPEVKAGFDSLTSNQVVGFRVNFSDSDTDEDERQLAKQFNIPYQHTKVILKNGQEVKRSGDQWDKDKFNEQINSVLQN